MRAATFYCCTRKTRLIFVLYACLGILSFLAVYDRIPFLLGVSYSSEEYLRSNCSCRPTQEPSPCRSSSITDVPSGTTTKETTAVHSNFALNHSLCADSFNSTKVTSCQSCLRPSVPGVGGLLRKVPFLDHLIGDMPPDFFKPSEKIVQPLDAVYLLEPRMDCPFLMVVQLSTLDRRPERDKVRNTWGSVAINQTWPFRNVNAKVKIVFVLGKPSPRNETNATSESDNMSQIMSESLLYNDILYLDVLESYRNLTLKVLAAFKWVRDSCPCVQFVLKVDDDTFVNVPLLVDTLLYHQQQLDMSILGFVYQKCSHVNREGRWQVPKNVYPMTCYPEYASGCGYVISFNALSKIVDLAPYVPVIPVEDVFVTGVMRRVTKCQLFSLDAIMTHYLDRHWDPCHVFHDLKMLGTSKDGQKIQPTWQSFLKGSCP